MELKTNKIIAKKENNIGWMIINNPERRNAISLEMREAMTQVFVEYEKDQDIRVLIIKGHGGKAFISGADISEFKEVRNNYEAEKLYAKATDVMTSAMNAFSKPIIAMIEGYCVGGGVATAIAADIRIAADNTKYAIPAAKLGLAYGFDNLRQLVELVGPANAKRILFTADMLDANTAHHMGLINEVVEVDKLEQYVIDMANRISINAPLTIMASKETVKHILRSEIRDLKKLDQLSEQCFNSNDFKEGREAFMEKRKPNFTGK
ncbi:MAG: enoyl-CoA hydratase [Hyphomicrobiales bacterium]|jgi:enoyl-CoA hydratase